MIPTLDGTVSVTRMGASGKVQKVQSTVKCEKVCATPSCGSSLKNSALSVSQGPAVTDDEDVESGQPPHARSDGYSPLPADAVSVRVTTASHCNND